MSSAKSNGFAGLDKGRRGQKLFDTIQKIHSRSADNWNRVIDIIEMGEDKLHPSFVTTDLIDRILHKPKMSG